MTKSHFVLEARDLSCSRGGKKVFSDLSFRVGPGEALAVSGRNGAGKTSLLRSIAGLLPFDSGELIWNNIIRSEVIDDFFDEIVYVGHSNSMSLDLSAAENLVFGIALSGISVTIDQTRIALGKFGLGKIGGKPIHTLSQGQKRRVCLTKLLFMSSKPLWILDEPFNGLDADSVDQFVKYFDEHLQNGGIIVYSTHSNVNFANPVRNLVL